MNKEINTLFSNYLLGQLTAAEKLAFEQRLASDADFEKAFLDHKTAMIAGQRIHHNEIRDSVSSILQQERNKNSTLKIRRLAVPIAAIFLLAIAAIFLFKPDPKPDALFADFYEAPPYSASRIGSDTTDYLEMSKSNFAKEEWGSTIINIEKLDSSRKVQQETQKVLAHALLNNDQETESIAIFKNLEKIGSNPSNNWYTGLAFLKLTELDSSLVYLQKIPSTNSNFAAASKLIRKIQKIKK